jgi:hypothetical protein
MPYDRSKGADGHAASNVTFHPDGSLEAHGRGTALGRVGSPPGTG